MHFPRLFICMVVLTLVTAVGCSHAPNTDKLGVHETKNPDAEEVLTLDPEADIFQYEGVI